MKSIQLALKEGQIYSMTNVLICWRVYANFCICFKFLHLSIIFEHSAATIVTYTGQIAAWEFHVKQVSCEFHVKFSREFHKNFTWNLFHVNLTFTAQFTWKFSHEFHVKFTCGDFACVGMGLHFKKANINFIPLKWRISQTLNSVVIHLLSK